MAVTASAGIRIGAGVLLAVGLAACSASNSSKTPALENYTAEEIYRQGELSIDSGEKPEASVRYFQEIERLYPYTQYAKRALIMQAFIFHKGKDYEEARSAAQRFIDFYPGDEDAPYAQYLLALSYYDQIEEVGRDQGLTYQALIALREVIERYPESDYASSAMMKFDLAFDHLAAKEMEIGRYYLARKHYTAAMNRFRNVVQDFQTSTHTAEALYRLVEVNMALGFDAEAQTAAAILGHNYQSSPFYEDAYKLLQNKGLTPAGKGDGWLAKIYRQTLRGEWL